MTNDSLKNMSFGTTVVALVNGMIGGSILVLPLVALQAGWLEAILVILITGIFSYYSCYLSILHLGDQKDLDCALLRHFNGSKIIKIFYDFCVWSSILLLLTLYF
jgi:amino acid permease